MGNFEKLSVLVIVVIIVMILVVALYTWGQTDDPSTEELAKTNANGSSYEPVAGDQENENPWPDPFEEDKEGDADPEAAKPIPPIVEPEVEGGGGTEIQSPPLEPDVPVVAPPAPPIQAVDTDVDEPWVYTVKSGDTVSQICERELGTWRRQKEVFALNPGLDPLTIRMGDKLKMPPRGRASSVKENAGAAAVAPAGSSKPVPGEWYVLRRGDRMSTVAKRAYGSIDRWPELWARNLSVVKDPDAVQEGTRIFIPK